MKNITPLEFYNDSILLYDSGVTETKPLFSVCLSSYNFESSIEQALRTIAKQSFNDYEIVMHDDCSTDNTCEVAINFIKSLKETDAKRMRIYKANTNGGILTNRLRAFSHCEGKWLIQTDGDDFSPYDRLEKTKIIIDSLDHEPMLISTNCYNWLEGTSYDKVPEMASVQVRQDRWVMNNDLVWQIGGPNGSSGFILNKIVFDAYYDSIPPMRIIADDPVLASRALYIGDAFISSTPVYYCRLSSGSASGGGESSKKWIMDRYNRFNLLELDLIHIRPDHSIPENRQKEINHWKKRMMLDAKLIDCSNLIWPFLWIKMIFISRQEAGYALKKRAKLILYGNINGKG